MDNIVPSAATLVNILKEHLITYGCCLNEKDVQYICGIISEELAHTAPEPEKEEDFSPEGKCKNEECVICKRKMPLIFHHLIPRTTHKKMKKKTKLTKQDLNGGQHVVICHV
jgi:hypothetical protein